ncbi:MAG: nicotinate phosphoribosyltransferase [Bifidobacteriaceae bacterium]|jgi:nicotinate phosphoribosyltransferase|nr:nicotinate phosphoribosyltransferase [Bifidobacteriaceae bacterium]
MTVSLLTDQYELTMLDAALEDGTATRDCVFEVFARRLPAGRRYGVVAGTGRLLEDLPDFRFDEADLGFLASAGIVRPAAIDYLAAYRFRGDIRGYPEGETYFPGSPILTVHGTFADAVLLETLALSILNHDSSVASAASRMTMAAGGRPCLEMGARRTHEWSAVAAARAAYVAGFAGTSVLEAGRRWGIPTIGTAAHAFTLVHDSEADAFIAQIAAQGLGTTLLTDTFDVEEAVRTAVRVAGPKLACVRIDSGDLAAVASEVRGLLDSLGNTDTKITVTNDLDEYAIAGLAAAPVDSYGVGTRLVTGSGAPTAEMVYKLVARSDASGQLRPVAKRVGGKGTLGGAKWAGRRVDDAGTAAEEIVITGSGPRPVAPDDYGVRPLEVDLVLGGEVQPGWTGADGLARARERHAASVAELPRDAHRLSAGEPAIPTVVTSHLELAGA